MMLAAFSFLRGSTVAQIVLAVLIGWGALKGYGAAKYYMGASDLAAKIEKKAKTNVRNANAVRDAVSAGKRGVQHPYTRRP